MSQSLRQRWGKTSLANRLNVLCVFLAAVAAIGSVSVAVLQYTYNKASTALDQRPWIAPFDERSTDVAVGSPFVVVLETKNFGKTPAIDVNITAKEFHIYREVGQDDESYERLAIQMLNDKVKDLPPPQYFGATPPSGQDAIPLSVPSHLLTSEELAAMQQKNLRVYYFGTITYSDLAHNSYETQFCFKVGRDIGGKVDPSGLMVHSCKTWNKMT